ncbi:MAG: amidohydrolase [Deltaproteobacteria bacterium]|nr:amidohydrolase [Deltaproteobacteria bacterium]
MKMTIQINSIDLILTNGNVLSLDDSNTRAQAVAIQKGRIAGIGATEELLPLAGEGTQIMDLNGKTVVPGFIESHNHFLSRGLLMSQIYCGSPPNVRISDILEKVAQKAQNTPRGQWVLGTNYDDTLLAEMRHPTRKELDEAAPEHPVYLRHISGHVGTANSKALELAGISRDTPDPPGGRIIKNPTDGDLTGLLEETARDLVRLVIPRPEPEDFYAALLNAQKEYLTVGVTSVHDLGFTEGGFQMARAYQQAVESGDLRIRIYLMFIESQLAGLFTSPRTDTGLYTGFGNDHLRIGALKLLQDGSIQAWTAALREPYLNRPEWRGYLWMNQGEFNHKVLAGHEAGFQVSIHTNGDWAIESALEAIGRAQDEVPRPNCRHRLEHCQLPSDDQLERMARMGVGASFFVQHTYYWGDRHVNLFLGEQRARHIDPLASALKKGVIFGLHSDCPVTPVNPLFGIWAAVNRRTRDGHILGPEQRISALDALRAFTINAAYLGFEEKEKGSLEAGKLADMAVLSDDPTSVDPRKIREIVVEKTIIGGQVVYDLSDRDPGCKSP